MAEAVAASAEKGKKLFSAIVLQILICRLVKRYGLQCVPVCSLYLFGMYFPSFG